MYNQLKRSLVFLNKAQDIHHKKYNYNNIKYINSYTPIEIICKQHGSFWQRPRAHLEGSGCPTCALEKRTTTREQFIKRSAAVFDGKYSYPVLPEFIKFTDYIEIECPQHGKFNQRADRHMKGHGCKECGRQKRSLTKEQFITRAKQTHGERYNYDQVDYKNIHTKILIRCPDHGLFNVSPALHIQRTGCPTCSVSYGHKAIRNVLDECGISFVEEHRFNDCRNKYPLPFDFFIPSKNILIEFDGEQHFMSIPAFGGKQALEDTKRNDKIKNQYANKKQIKLVRVPYTQLNNIECIIKSQLK